MRAQPKLYFGRSRHFVGQENISPPRPKKTWFTDTDPKKASQRRSGKMTDQGLKKKHHRMMPIEHFLIDIIQILFRDWNENTIADVGHYKAVTDTFQPTLCNFFCKHWPIMFRYGKGSFVVGVAYQIFNVGWQGFFVLAQQKLCFVRHRHVFICSASITIAHLGNKKFTDMYRKKC